MKVQRVTPEDNKKGDVTKSNKGQKVMESHCHERLDHTCYTQGEMQKVSF